MRTHAGLRITLDVLGGLAGLVVGAILAVNIVIFAGIEGGYEATFPEIFRENLAVGVVTVLILAASPVFGVVWAHRLQRDRDRH